MKFSELMAKALNFHQCGKYEDAKRLYRLAKSSNPSSPEVFFALGNTFRLCGEFDKAAEEFRCAIELKPDFFAAHFNLGSALRELKQFDDALIHLREALRLKPESVDAYFNLGLTFSEMGLFSEALDIFQRGLSLKPDSITILNEIGKVFMLRKDPQEAKKYFLGALEISPEFAEAHFNLGVIMREWNRLDESVICFRNALRFRPKSSVTHINMGESLLTLGEIELSEEYFRKALELDHDCILAHDNLLLAMNYNPAYSPITILEEHRRRPFEFSAPDTGPSNNPDPARILRIGYVSPDFCKHPSASFLEPIIRNHDPLHFEVFCYSQTLYNDEMTARFKELAHHWREIKDLTDKSAFELIRNDRIDILVDCAGHMSGNRLGIFVLRAAPVQISGIGYPNTTGLQTIDYRLTDDIADPPIELSFHTEDLVRLKPLFCCYAPHSKAPPVTPLPAQTSGQVTFGSLHTLSRLNKKVITLWAEVLRAIPLSRLLIFRTTLTPTVIKRLTEWFCESGIDPGRVVFESEIGPEGYLSLYSSIDISLDTFPWSGHTTACESLWMGVPVITLRGDRFAGRMVCSVLTSMAMENWIAQENDQYIKIARKWAADPVGLSEIRSSLRDKMLQSKLCDGEKYTAFLEQCYVGMWKKWCEKNGS